MLEYLHHDHDSLIVSIMVWDGFRWLLLTQFRDRRQSDDNDDDTSDDDVKGDDSEHVWHV